MVCAPGLQDASGWRLSITGQPQAVSVVLGAVAANLSAVTRPGAGDGQRSVEGDGIAALCHRTVTVAIKPGHAQREVSSGAGRSVLPADLCSDSPADWSLRARS